MDLTVYRPVAGWRVLPFDAAEARPTFLVESADGRKWQVSRMTADLLSILDEQLPGEQAAARLAEVSGLPVTSRLLQEQIDRLLVPNGLVVDRRVRGPSAPVARAFGGRLNYLAYRRTLIRASELATLSRVAAMLFNPALFWLCFLAAVTGAVWYVATQINPAALRGFTPTALAVLITLVSAFVHELGHAAACRRFGCKHGDLGFGLYLVFPVLYMEVDDTWRLPRKERAIVDAAGVYLQLLFALGMVGLGELVPSLAQSTAGAMLLMLGMIVTNLNPLFRFDGYWLLSDLLGVPNLRQRSLEMTRAVWRARQPERVPSFVALSVRQTTGLVVYAIATVGFSVYYFALFYSKLPAYIQQGYPELVARSTSDAIAAASVGRIDIALVNLLNLFPATGMVAGAVLTPIYLLYRLGLAISRSPGGRRSPASQRVA
jgi:putative peptide zinc metalloprotease protein